MMKFELTKKLKQSYIYEIDELNNTTIDAMANSLTGK